MRLPNGSLLLTVGVLLGGTLLRLVVAPPLLGAGASSRLPGDLHGVRRHLPAARLLGERLEVVGGLVDRLQVALVLVLLADRGEVGVPALGHRAARGLHIFLAERGREFEEQHELFDVHHRGHKKAGYPGARNRRTRW